MGFTVDLRGRPDYAKQHRGPVGYVVRYHSSSHIELVKYPMHGGDISIDGDPIASYNVKTDKHRLTCDCPATWNQRGRGPVDATHKHFQWANRYQKLVEENKAHPRGPQLFYDAQDDRFYPLETVT